jgi:hypothetical protein
MERTDVPDKSEVIFIIFGSPRSGTTLLKETLSRNSNIFIPHETNIVTPIAYIIESIKNPIIGKELIGKLIVSSKDYQHALGQHLDESEIFHALQYGKYTLAGVLNSIYGTLAKKMNKKRCGDKSPNDLQSVHLLQELGLLDSDIKIIHLVRDVRSVVASLLNVDWAPKDIELTFPRQWNTTNMHLYQAMQGNANYFLLRYEDMVAYPKESFAGACQFLDVKFEEGMLSELNRGVSLRRRQAHHKNLAQPFLTSRVNSWETELPSDIIKHTEQLADEGLSLFGYQKTFQ